MKRDRGSALVEAIVIGSVAVLAVIPILSAASTLQSARESVAQASQVAAAEATRTGNLEAAVDYVARVLPDAQVQVESSQAGVIVTVGMRVEMLGLGGLAERWVEATARSSHSPYRSAIP